MAAQPTSSNKPLYIVVGFMFLIIFGIFGYMFYTNREQAVTEEILPTKSSYVAPKTPIEDSGKITVWAWNTAAKSLQSLVPGFNKLYPNINVTVLEIGHDEANAKFRAAVSSGTGFPDVWDSEGVVTYEYIRSGALEDLTDRVSKYKNDFVPYKWTEVSYNDRIYAMPWDTAPAVLFYRKDLFEEAGVKPEDIATWDDFIVAGKKVTKDTNGDGKPDQFMTLMSQKSDVEDFFQLLLSQYGGSLFDASGRPTINTQAGVDSIVLMKKLLDANITADIRWWQPEMFEGIKSGKIASLPQGAWMGGQIKKTAPNLSGKWAVMPIPATKIGGVRSAVRGGSNLAIPSKSSNKEAAWQFIEYALANKESQLKMYKEYNIFPALIAAYSDPVFNEPDEYFSDMQTSRLFITAQERLPLDSHYGSYYLQTTKILSTEIINVLKNLKTPQQALDDSQAQLLSQSSRR